MRSSMRSVTSRALGASISRSSPARRRTLERLRSAPGRRPGAGGRSPRPRRCASPAPRRRRRTRCRRPAARTPCCTCACRPGTCTGRRSVGPPIVVGDRELQHGVERGSAPASAASSACACGTVRGKPSRMNPFAASGSRSRSVDHPDHDVVAARTRRVHVALGLDPERRASWTCSRKMSPVEICGMP